MSAKAPDLHGVGAWCIQLCSISPGNTSGKVGVRGPSEWTGRGRGAACVKGECKQGLVDLHLSWTLLEMMFGSVAGREERGVILMS